MCLKIIFFYFFFIEILFSAPINIQAVTTSVSSTGSATSLSQNQVSKETGLSQKFEISNIEVNKIQLNFSSLSSQISSSKLIVKDKSGADRNLDKNKNDATHVVSFGAAYVHNDDNLQINFGQNVDSSDFLSKNSAIEYIKSINEKTTLLGAKYSVSDSKIPQTFYFDNISGKWISRPQQILQQKISIHSEQLWSEQYKNKLELMYFFENQERPQAAGLEFKQLFAVNSKNSVNLNMGGISEDRNQNLKNERGFYSTMWIEAGFTHAFTYNFLLSPSYGYIQEYEKNSRSDGYVDRSLSIFSDLWALQMQYLNKGWSINLKAELLESNSGFKSDQIQGGFQWEI